MEEGMERIVQVEIAQIFPWRWLASLVEKCDFVNKLAIGSIINTWKWTTRTDHVGFSIKFLCRCTAMNEHQSSASEAKYRLNCETLIFHSECLYTIDQLRAPGNWPSDFWFNFNVKGVAANTKRKYGVATLANGRRRFALYSLHFTHRALLYKLFRPLASKPLDSRGTPKNLRNTKERTT